MIMATLASHLVKQGVAARDFCGVQRPKQIHGPLRRLERGQMALQRNEIGDIGAGSVTAPGRASAGLDMGKHPNDFRGVADQRADIGLRAKAR